MKAIVKQMFKNGNDLLQHKITRQAFWERHVEHERQLGIQRCFNFRQKGDIENVLCIQQKEKGPN